MKKVIFLLSFISLVIVNVNAQFLGIGRKKKIIFPDGELTQKQICGQKKCEPGNAGAPFVFRRYYSPDVNNASNEIDIALQLIGHTFPEGDLRGQLVLPCLPDGSPFSYSDITTVGSSNGRNMDYERYDTLKIDVNAAIQANLDSLKKFTTDKVKLQNLEAAIRFAYSKIAGKNLKIVGKYSEWSFKDSAINELVQGHKFDACKDSLSNKNWRIITSVGIVIYNISYEQNSIDTLAALIQAAAEKEGIQANIGFTFKKTVSENLKASTPNLYSIVVWRSMNYKDFQKYNGITNP